MKEAHLTVRVPDAVAAHLDERAEALGVPRSQVVREAVTLYLGGGSSDAVGRPVTARALAHRWQTLPWLTEPERRTFVELIAESRADRTVPNDPWA
jgi:hypothetical protein